MHVRRHYNVICDFFFNSEDFELSHHFITIAQKMPAFDNLLINHELGTYRIAEGSRASV